MFKSSGTAAATQPSGGFGNAQNTQIKPIRPMTTPQTATSGGTSSQRISGAGRATAPDETALSLEKPNDWNEYLKKSVRQVILGNYTDDVTLGGTLMQIGLGLLGADLPADLRDIYYDWTHLKTTPWYQTLLDMVAILPGVGALKYVDEGATLLKHEDEAIDAVKAAGKASNTADAAQTAAKTAGKTTAGTKLPPEVLKAREKQLLEAIDVNIRAGYYSKTDEITSPAMYLSQGKRGISDFQIPHSITEKIQSQNWNASKGTDSWIVSSQSSMHTTEYSRIKDRIETANLYDSNGVQIFEKNGDSTTVHFEPKEISQMSGGVLTHNHPDNSCFSPEDINMLRFGNLEEIRVSTARGVYRIQRPEQWDKSIATLDMLKKEYYLVDEEVSTPIYNRARMGEISFSEAAIISDQTTVFELCRRHNIPFCFTPWTVIMED